MADDVDERDSDHWTEEFISLSRSQDHWTEVVEKDDVSAETAADNWEVFCGLQQQWPGGFFQVMGDEWKVERKLAAGGQAEIFEAEQTLPDGTKEKWALKRFKPGLSLRYVMKQFPKGMLRNLRPNGCYSNGHSCSIYGLMMLQDGSFAILMKRYWGDLRSLIDLMMRRNNNQDFPFPDMSVVVQIMLDIALGMQALHEDGIVHRDLKASNVLIWSLGGDSEPLRGGKFLCHVADFELSVGVWGTRFWMAPEILLALKNRNLFQHPDSFTEKSDVYSFAMTCYEILTGRIPFEGHSLKGRDLVLRGARPELPESLDFWIRELLQMCWHSNPQQRPSFEQIVDILQSKSREGREPDILASRSSTWEEVNDLRVRRDQDQSMEMPEKFPVVIEMLAAALQCCEKEVERTRSLEGQVVMFKSQCEHLVTSLSSDADNIFHRFQQVWRILKEPVITNAQRQRFELKYWFQCVAFGIHTLVDLTRNLQMVVRILLDCGSKDWATIAFQYSTTPPHPEIPRRSVFDLAFQQCQWSMDFAHLAVKEIYKLAIGSRDWMFIYPGLHWREERQREVQQTAVLSGSLAVAATLEARDRNELFKELEMLLRNIPSKSLQHSGHKNELKLSSFLMAKLAGPVPQPSYLPYSFQIDPPINLVSRSPVTAIWCDKILCHVKKRKAPAYEIRRIMEVDAAPLAAVQHPNVVRLIGCTVESSEHLTGMSRIVTRLVYPSKRALLHGATGVLVMELMEGDLRKLMDQRCPNPGPGSRPFPLVVALDIMLQIAEAMRFVHEHKILHRDLKTTNILFNTASSGAVPSYPTLNVDRIRELDLLYLLTPERFYTVKLADFDLAMYSPSESSQIVDEMIGTPRYMAPEMFFDPEAEVPSKYNWSCDVFSFAMTCSAILTGNEPFHFVKNSSRCDVMASVVGRMAERQVRPDLGLGDALPGLKSLVERCWDMDPLQRPPFSEICRELRDCKREATVSCLWRR